MASEACYYGSGKPAHINITVSAPVH